ncbi:cytochrome P450 ClCP1 [Dactylonectria macrodidyma]|uniref:Cytochrome P450 ClCP1 n=1 Tax=Dactylonectria macrodidyma TaxID=307937 RepID=A0A9P9EZ12_9HYPO|nr:cytochrome P450 ClCP1 [Dactylonectria macrodidyma]
MALPTLFLETFVSSPKILTYGILLVAIGVTATASVALYNIFLSPLSSYPGPKLSAATSIPYLNAVLTGSTWSYVYKLHQKYGDVVRISPNELSYTSAQAWRDINAHRLGKTLPDKEAAFYVDLPNGVPSLFSVKNKQHGRLRRPLAHAFSEKALRDQDDIIKTYIDGLIKGLKSKASNREVVDMHGWLNWTTFDLMGSLSFGEDFGCLNNQQFHPWVKIIFDMVRATAMMGAIRRYPGAQKLIELLVPAAQKELQVKHQKMTDEKVARRLAMTTDRPDFMTCLLKNKDKQEALSDAELSSGMFATIVAGSETTATALSATLNLLARNPYKMRKIQNEVRSAFNEDSEIDTQSTIPLKYMIAVINEAMRIYPPVPIGMPRVIPEGGLTVLGRYLPGGTIVSVHQYASYHDPKYWRRPHDFIPERWLDDPEYADDNRKIFQPFSLGARNCIGQNLAYAELRSICARLIFNFDFELADPYKDWFAGQRTYMIWEKGPLEMRISHAKV